MYVSYKERLAREPRLRDFSNWPKINLFNIDKNKRKGFITNCRIVKMALSGMKYVEIRDEVGIRMSKITELLNRALSGEETENPPLTKALIPGVHIRKSQRRNPLPTIDNPVGAKNAFGYLLNTVPGLKDKLDIILKKHIADNPKAENIQPDGFFSAFIDYLEEKQYPTDTYPYTEESLGYESARRYFHRRFNELKLEDKATRKRNRVIHPSKTSFEFGRELQLDEQTNDAHSKIYLAFEDDYAPLRLARASLVLAADANSTLILGYKLVLNTHCSQYDVIDALEDIHKLAAPRIINTPGIYCPPGPAFPKEISEMAARVAINVASLDNALAHHARAVSDYLCDYDHGEVALGLKRAPTVRNVIERAFALLSRHMKRFNSTTGKNSSDPLRESRKNEKIPPAITLLNLEDAIYAILATHNHTHLPRLMGNTPLEFFHHHMATKLLRLIPVSSFQSHKQYEISRRVTVRWLKNDKRKPHIYFEYCRYGGGCLNSSALVYKKVEIRFDYRDIRVLHVYTLEGKYIGEVYPPKPWRRYAHGIKTRQYITRYCRLHNRKMKDPLSEFFWLQLQRKNQPKAALEIARLYEEYTAFPSQTEKLHEEFDSEQHSESEQESTTSSTVQKWSPDMANVWRTNDED